MVLWYNLINIDNEYFKMYKKLCAPRLQMKGDSLFADCLIDLIEYSSIKYINIFTLREIILIHFYESNIDIIFYNTL